MPLSTPKPISAMLLGRNARGDRDEGLGDVPGDREPLEPHAAPLQTLAGNERTGLHQAASGTTGAVARAGTHPLPGVGEYGVGAREQFGELRATSR